MFSPKQFVSRSQLFQHGLTQNQKEVVSLVRSSCLQMFYKIYVLKNLAKIHRKIHVSESLFNKVADLQPAFLLKKRLWHRSFPVNFGKFYRALTEHVGATASVLYTRLGMIHV